MKILYVNPIGKLGGAERAMLDLMASIRAACPSLELELALFDEGPVIEAAEALGARCHILPLSASLREAGDSWLRGKSRLRQAATLMGGTLSSGVGLIDIVRKLQKLIRVTRPDVIHSNGNKAHLLSWLATPRRIGRVWYLHDFIGSRPLMCRLLRPAARGLTAGIAVSHAVAEDARRALPRLPVEVVYNAIDVDYFSPLPTEYRENGDLESDAGQRLDRLAGWPESVAEDGLVRIGLVGTYAHWKGHDVFLNAASQIVADQPQLPVRFYIIGGPIYATKGSQFTEGELKGLAKSLGIADRVAFVPFLDDVAAAYRGLDIVVHASIHPEPFGRTIVEAMSCGKGVLVSRAGGAGELFTSERDALGFPPGDVPTLARAMRRLIEDRDLLARLGQAARNTAVQRFSRQRLAGEVLPLYARAIPELRRWLINQGVLQPTSDVGRP